MQPTPEIIKKLAKLHLFSEFKIEFEKEWILLEKLCECLEVCDFPSGTKIIEEGAIDDCLYILYKGSVQVFRTTANGKKLEVVDYSDVNNVFFGELSFVDDDARSATVAATSNCTTLRLKKDVFFELCKKEPEIGFKVMLKIAQGVAYSLRKSASDVMTLYTAMSSRSRKF